MRQTIVLPNDTREAHRFVLQGLGDIANTTMVHDINELSEQLLPIKDDNKLVIIDFLWDNGYELAIQDCANTPTERRNFINKTPVICIHGTPSYISPQIRKRLQDQLGVIGFVSVQDSYRGINTHSRLRDVIIALQNYEGEITPSIFNDVIENLPVPTPKRLHVPTGPR